MSKIGAPKTSKVPIGACELRIANLELASLQTSDHSVGFIRDIKLNITSETADLKGGHSPVLYDVATTSSVTGFTATLQEASYRNLRMVLSGDLQDYDPLSADVFGDVVNPYNDLVIGKHSNFRLTGPEGFTLGAGDLVVVYQESDPGRASVMTVEAFTAPVSPAVYAVVDMGADTPLLGLLGNTLAFSPNTLIKWYKPNAIGVGVDQFTPKYFSAQLLQLNRPTGKPVGWNFWKVVCVPTFSTVLGAGDWSTFEVEFKALRPYPLDYVVDGSPLHHVLNRILNRPVFEVFDAPDCSRTEVYNPRLMTGIVDGEGLVTGGLAGDIILAGVVEGEGLVLGDITVTDISDAWGFHPWGDLA